MDDGKAVGRICIDGDFLCRQLARELSKILSGQHCCARIVDLGRDGEDKAELIVGSLEFELSFLCRHVDARKDRRLRFGGETFADDLQCRDEVVLGK